MNTAANDTKQKYNAQSGTIIVIPALNPDEELISYVAALKEKDYEKILIVNDGSSPSCASIFDALSDMDCVVLNHDRNKGKGQALKTAFSHILAQGLDCLGVVTADADGQHAISDIEKLAEKLQDTGDSVILGVRDLRAAHVPTRSRIGNGASALAFRFLYGVDVQDTQTGLRAIPRSLLGWAAEISGARFEYEMNMLIRAKKNRIPLVEVPIHTIYAGDEHVSHFKTVSDTIRIFCVLIRGLLEYALSSCLSAITDITVFYLATRFLFGDFPPATKILWGTLLARVLSSLLNFTLNKRFVFSSKGNTGNSMFKYAALWCLQLSASYAIVYFAQTALNLPLVAIKAVTDIILALFSYQIQLHWVFR